MAQFLLVVSNSAEHCQTSHPPSRRGFDKLLHYKRSTAILDRQEDTYSSGTIDRRRTHRSARSAELAARCCCHLRSDSKPSTNAQPSAKRDQAASSFRDRGDLRHRSLT